VGPNLAGKWKASKVSIGAPSVIDITPYDTEGLSMRIEDWGWAGARSSTARTTR
jgi:hypothetical protein